MPESKKDLVKQELGDLQLMDDVLACMVAKRGLEGIYPNTNKLADINIWKILNETTDQFFQIIDKFYVFGMERLYFELGNYTIIIAPIDQTFSLLTVSPSLANMGLLDIEIENTKNNIKKIINL